MKVYLGYETFDNFCDEWVDSFEPTERVIRYYVEWEVK